MPVKAVGVEAMGSTGTHELPAAEHSATQRMVAAQETGVDTTRLDYNLLDLDVTVQHVHLPSMLHEPAGFRERRTSLVDVLKKAIEKEPDRRDLRMKLLETYFAAASTNRQGFLEVVEKLARERKLMSEGEWDKIASMGRQIAADNELFAAQNARTDEEDLANCA